MADKSQIIQKRKAKPPNVGFLFTLGRILLYLPLKLIYPTKVIGKRNFDKNKRLIITMNHKSGWDPVIMAHLFHPDMYFLAKEAFLKSKFLAWLLRNLGCIFVHRGEPDYSAAKKVLTVLQNDKVLALFPEGTRNKINNGYIAPYKTGAVYYAIKEKSHIVPMVIDKRLKPFTRNTIIVGDEIDFSDFYDKPITKELLEDANKILIEKTNELQKQLQQIKENK